VRTQKVLYWFLQLASWIGLAGIIFLVNKANGVAFSQKSRLALFFFSFLGIAITHSIRYFVLRYAVFQKNTVRILIIASLLCLIGAFLFQLIYDFVRTFLTDNGTLTLDREFVAQTFVMILIFVLWMVIYFFFHLVQKNRMQEVENLKLADIQKTMELQVMRSQLNPHFLFNSLNSIRALISIEPKKAEEGVGKLSNILRNILLFTRKESVPLQEELAFIEDYLGLEKIRFEERLTYKILVSPNLLSFHIPPLILQSLVENAIKHGVSNRKNGGIVQIEVSQSQEIITISVINSGSLVKNKETGIGLDNIRYRLSAFFGTAVRFDLFENEDNVHAIIEIDVKNINR